MDETTSARETTLTRDAAPTDGVTAASAPGAGEAAVPVAAEGDATAPAPADRGATAPAPADGHAAAPAPGSRPEVLGAANPDGAPVVPSLQPGTAQQRLAEIETGVITYVQIGRAHV